MPRYSSDLEKYCTYIVNGRIRACNKVKKVCQRLLNDIANPGKWHFDKDKADRAVYFIENYCCIPSGKLGAPFKLELYEKAWVQAIFGFVGEDGFRRYQEVLIIVGRKNGKTSLSSAIELYMLVADGEGSPQVYNVANSQEQASLGFNAAHKMVRMSSKLAKKVTKRDKDLYCNLTMGTIKALAANTGTMDGLDVHCGVIDELAAMKDRDLYDLVKQGMSARDQPLLLTITTNGFVRNGIFDAQYEYAEGWLDGSVKDDRFLALVYELDDRNEWTDEANWVKPNPGLGTVKKREFLRNGVNKAKQDPTYLPTLLTKDFNVPENSAAAWLNFQEATNAETVDMKAMGFRYGIVGFDAADSIDLTSAQIMMMRPGDDHIYELSMHWIPEDVILKDMESGSRKERDGVPYQMWIKRGLMRTVPGNKVDKRCLTEWLEEVEREYGIYVYAIGYDPWHIDVPTKHEYELFVGKERCVEVRQGPKTLSQPMKQLKVDYETNRIIDNHNPVNEWARMNVAVRVDTNGNIQPEKSKGDPRHRIDPFMAELDAYVTLYNFYDEYMQMI